MPDPAETKETAERAVRRGELSEALRLYRRLLAESPGDDAARARIAAIQSLLQPHELTAPSSAPSLPDVHLPQTPTPEQRAELLFERGDLAAALAAYERIVEERPENELARERRTELAELCAISHGTPKRPKPLPPRSQLLEALLERIAARRKT